MKIRAPHLLIIFVLLLATLFSTLALTSCKKEPEAEAKEAEAMFYCNLTNRFYSWYDHNNLIQKAAKANAEYRAIKIAEEKGVSVQYEIREKNSNILSLIIKYDANGKILGYEKADHRGVVMFSCRYEYNDAGMLSKIYLITRDGKEVGVGYSFEYDSDNKCTRYIHYDNYLYGSPLIIVEDELYEYSNGGKTVKVTPRYYGYEENSEMEVRKSVIYEYNDSGKIIKASYQNIPFWGGNIDNNGEENYTHYIEYHYKDLTLQKEVWYYTESNGVSHDMASQILLRQKYEGHALLAGKCEYDSSDRLSKILIYDPWNIELEVLFELVFEYDAKDNKIRESVVRDGKTVMSAYYEYGEDDICTKTAFYDEKQNVLLEYDEYLEIVAVDKSDSQLSFDFDFGLRLIDKYYGVKGKELTLIQ